MGPNARATPLRRVDLFFGRSHLLLVTLIPSGLIGGLFSGAAILSRRGRRDLVNKLLSAALLVSFIMLPTTSTAIFRTFHCKTLDDGTEYLVAVRDARSLGRQGALINRTCAVHRMCRSIASP